MNFVKRAWLRSSTHVGKTLILVGLLFVICTMALSGLMISSAGARAAADAKAKVGAVATMRLDLNAYLEAGKGAAPNGSSAGQIGADANLYSGWADKIGKSGVVSHYNYLQDGANAPTNGAKPYNAVPRPPNDQSNFPDLVMTNGVRDSAVLAEFKDGRSKLLEGKPLTPDTTGNQALIEERFAKANNLHPGDKFWMEVGTIGQKKEKFEFTVAGVYRSEVASNISRYTPPMNEPGNNIYLTIEGASRLAGTEPGPKGSVIHQATFTLSDPDDLGKLKDAAKAADVDPDMFPISLNDKQYQDLVGPISSTAAFANLAVWLISAAGVVILALIITATVKERHTELGILLAQGEPRPKLIGQLLVEVVACAVIAIGLAGLAAQFVSPMVGDALLSGEVADARDAVADQPDPSKVNGGTRETPATIDKFEVRLDAADLVTVGALGLGIVFLATALPGMSILRLRPRDILLKGN